MHFILRLQSVAIAILATVIFADSICTYTVYEFADRSPSPVSYGASFAKPSSQLARPSGQSYGQIPGAPYDQSPSDQPSYDQPSDQLYGSDAGSSSYLTKCYTTLESYAPLQSPTTQWNTAYTPCTSTFTETQTVSKSLPASNLTFLTTTTVVSFSTTTIIASTTTNTATITFTTTATLTIIAAASFSTLTSTSTTSVVGTSIVPTKAGSLPVESTLPGSNFAKRRSPAGLVERAGYGQPIGRYIGNIVINKTIPYEINCNVYIPQCSIITVTAMSLAKRATSAAATDKSTVTNVLIVTKTSFPFANTTTTITSTSTSTTVTTPTVLTTSTSIETTTTSTSTSYAACATNNIINQVNNATLAAFYTVSGNVAGSITTSDTTAKECCKSAILNPLSAVWALYSGGCIIYVAGSCATLNQESTWQTETLNPFPADHSPFFTGNGFCDEINSNVENPGSGSV